MFGLGKTRTQIISGGEGPINLSTTDMKKKRKRQRGFTLIEMMAVVVILSIVSGLGYVLVSNQIEQSRQKTDAANCRLILDAAQRYLTDNGPNSVSNIASGSGRAVDSYNDLILKGYLQSAPTTPWSNSEGYIIKYSTSGVTGGPTSGINGTLTVESGHSGGATAVGSY
jgi:prepilin-type N-terminal cleavage/methylation domain-containing protein